MEEVIHVQSKTLENNHEIVGLLQKVESNDQYIKLDFTLHRTYELPIGALSEKKLQSLVGERVGVFNCDNVYKLRRANKK